VLFYSLQFVNVVFEKPVKICDVRFRQAPKRAARWTSASSTMDDVPRCALIRIVATTVPVEVAINWRSSTTPAQVGPVSCHIRNAVLKPLWSVLQSCFLFANGKTVQIHTTYFCNSSWNFWQI